MSLANLRRGLREFKSLQDNIFNCCPNLSRTLNRRNATHSSSQTGERDARNVIANRFSFEPPGSEVAVPHQEQNGAGRQVRIDRRLKSRRDSHRRCRDQKGDLDIVGVDTECLSHQQFSEVVPLNFFLHLILDLRAESLEVESVDPPIHEAEAICWADNCYRACIEN